MATHFWFVPRKGYKIRDPKTGRHVPAGGAKVPYTKYWRRKISWGDGTEGEPPKSKPKKTKKKREEPDS